ncbi:hypothetical protein [Streptomyces sp. NPDC058086]|uniref:hypothetical protein n=1 Tax=Streptomyces sp. NPDC058086 TaxID=3346334 RepID=UPI0036E9ED89
MSTGIRKTRAGVTAVLFGVLLTGTLAMAPAATASSSPATAHAAKATKVSDAIMHTNGCRYGCY